MHYRKAKRSTRLVALAAVTSELAACLSSASPAPGALPTAGPSEVAASATAVPTPTPRHSAAAPTETPPLTFSVDEQRLLEAIRVDARIGCGPTRGDIQPRATAAVDCFPESPQVQHISAFLVPPLVSPDGLKAAVALQTYLELLASYGVQPRTGNCAAGTSGDSSWPDYLPDDAAGTGYEVGPYSPRRSGCFLDQNGIANVAVTCYADISIWIFGDTADLASLYAWTWRVAEGESPDRDPPGICAFAD
jgi:hypothetical protein